MARKIHLIWKIPLALTGVVLGIAILVLIAAVGVVYSPSARKAILANGVAIANEKTDYDIDLGRLYLSPFHHSPMVLYRAYKGQDDLPLQVEIDSLFVGHRNQDTLVCVHALRLNAKIQNSKVKIQSVSEFLSVPIEVEQLYLDNTTFHSDSLIAAVGIDALVGLLNVSSPELNISKGQYPLHGLRLADAHIGIDLRETSPDTTAQDTTPMLMAFEVPDGELKNVRFRLTPIGLDVHTDTLSVNVLADVGENKYDARRIDIGGAKLGIGTFALPIDTLYGNAYVNLGNNKITSDGLHVRSDEMGANADLYATEMDLNTMQVDVEGAADFRGSKARLRALYDIDDEVYDAQVEVEKVNLSPFFKDNMHVVLAGDIEAKGRGIDPKKAMRSKVKVNLTDATYNQIDVSGLRLNAELADKTVEGTLHLPFAMSGDSMNVSAQTEHQFHVTQFMTPKKMTVEYHTQMRNVRAQLSDKRIVSDSLRLDFSTDSTTAIDLKMPQMRMTARSPMHVLQLVNNVQPLLAIVSDSSFVKGITSLQELTLLDTLRQRIPALQADIRLAKGSPLQPFIDSTGIDLSDAGLTFSSDSSRTDIALNSKLSVLNAHIAPVLRLAMAEGKTEASLTAATRLTDGIASVEGLCTDAALHLDLSREGNTLHGNGRLTLDSLTFNDMDFGNRSVDMAFSPSVLYANAIRADVRLDDIPLDIVDSIMQMNDLDLRGTVRAKASADGLPNKLDLSAEVLPIDVSAEYKPYQVELSLGARPIVMEHNHVDLNGLPIYGADSTFIALTGGLDLDSMQLNVVLEADSFAPVKLEKGGHLPIYGELATNIRGTVTGALDSIVADVDVTILPTTDITYPIDKKNLAQVRPHGTVNVRYAMADNVPLNLGGQVNVDDGFVRYSPNIYPIMPFHVDSGSNVSFHGSLGQTKLKVSASQKVKADVESQGEETRRVDFTTGVRVNGVLDSIGLNSIGFFLEAPDDEAITRELSTVDEDTREGLAATLLATGMYVGESNVAAQRDGYALSSIINSRINAAMANSKMGKIVDIDFSSAQTNHAVGKTNDMNIAISKSFFKDKLRVTVGTSISDNPEVNNTNGLLQSLTADYKLTQNGDVLLRLFSQRDYNNVLEGELYKYGIGVRATKEWRRKEEIKSATLRIKNSADSITRVYGLTADAGMAYRSNNSIGPDLTLKSSFKNLMGRGETFTIKGNGAYYWALRNRHPGDPKKTDTYKLGVNTALVFPYLHWAGDHTPDGDTRYMLGYQYENIAGGYGVHKISGSFTYFIRSENNPYITHAFTPFSLSVVIMKAETDSLLNKAAEFPQLIKVIAGNEFVPSIGYNFIYNDYRSKRAVNTMLDLGVKESGNLINALYCAFGHKWDEKNKVLGAVTFNQFVKVSGELRNKFNLTDEVAIATRLFAGANIPLGNSSDAPLSEAFYAGGANGMRAAAPYAYGPGNFYSPKYNQNFFHAGDVKMEANLELRFPIVWKLFGAAFVDAGNVWSWYSMKDRVDETTYQDIKTMMQLPTDLYDGLINNPDWARQIALGTGAGLRLDLDGLVIRLDLGVGIHAPYQTYQYDKEGKVDMTQPITNYFNIPSALDAIRVNFGIGYPF